MTKINKLLTLFLTSFVLFSCTSNGAGSSSSHDYSKNLKINFDFDSHDKEYIINKATGERQKVNYIFNESNAEKIFKAPSDPLFKQGVHGSSLYLDGHSTRMILNDFDTPTDKLTISCWIAPRGFENLVDYDWESIARGHPRLSAIANQGHMENGEGFTFGYGRLGKWGLQLCLHNNETDDDFMMGFYDPLNKLKLYEWNHIAASYDGKTGYIALFYNGQRAYESYIPELVDTEIITSYEKMYVCYYNSPQIEFGCHRQYPAGLIDDFKLYEDSLPLKTVRDEYLAGCVNGNHPVLPFDEVKEDRSQYEGDRYRSIYHGIPSAVWMNEPHAPIYYKGMYHLFYQHNPIGPYWSQIRWAHLASRDLIHWESVKDAVVPTEGICPEGVWTGGSVIGPDGTPWLIITAGTNTSTWTGQNIAFAHCADPDDPYLTDWIVEDKVTITQPAGDIMGEREQFRDPFVWFDDGIYYMLVSTSIPGRGGSANVFTSKNMRDWTYHGYLYECPFDQYPVQGAHWECVVMFPISSKDGSIKKYILFDCPQYTVDGYVVDCLYWIGQFDKTTCKFIPDDHEPKLFDYGKGIYTGQTGFCYLTEEDKANGKTRYDEGRTVIIALAQGKSAGTAQNIDAGWAHSLAMPVEIHLDTDGKTVLREPIKELTSAYSEVLYEQEAGTSLNVNEINSEIENIRGDALEIKAKIHINSDSNYSTGLHVRYNKNVIAGRTERSSIVINDNGVFVNRTDSTLLDYVDKSDTNTFGIHEKNIELTILMDRSCLEVYINNKDQITSRIYPKCSDSDYLHFFDNNANISVSDVKITKFDSIYFDETTPAYYGNTGTLEELVYA
ncbi:MAG: GH32 C-terminal domain-containing protein [Bacilli bacterium]|nr:GH32 C-terminal domain-containing protein [Bacilli bacterium]